MKNVHLLKLAVAGVGQTLLLAFAWGLLAALEIQKTIYLHWYPIVPLMGRYPKEETLVVTLVATVLAVVTTSCCSIAFKEALRHRMHKSISLLRLTGGINIARLTFLISFGHIPTTLVTIGIFALAKMLVSCWSTLIAPIEVPRYVQVHGLELSLGSSYFESLLQQPAGSSQALGNFEKIIDINSFLSGITTAQFTFGVRGLLDYNGVSFNISTGGVLPVAPGYTGTYQQAQTGNVSNLQHIVPPGEYLSTNFTIFQEGLSANVTCGVVTDNPIKPIGSTSIQTPSSTWVLASSYQMPCNEGDPNEQISIVLADSQGTVNSSVGTVTSFVCPSPSSQTLLDWSHLNVTTQGLSKYQFLGLTNCQITPILTTSQVAYASGILNVTVVNSTALSSSNTYLAQFLASMITFQSSSAQSLVSNSIGDALYSIAVSSGTSTDVSQAMDPALLRELEQYWRGVIEFSGTFLRNNFSPNATSGDGLVDVTGYQTVTTMGWTQRKPIYLYTVLPVTFFALWTYAAIGYSLWYTYIEQTKRKTFTTFDPANPIHLLMVSSTRAPDGKQGENLAGESIGGFKYPGILENEELKVELDDINSSDGQVRKRFKLLTPVKASETPKSDAGHA